MIDDGSLLISFGCLNYRYTPTFLVYLLIGWAAVLLHARQNFDQPTYEMTPNEPTSIMIPRFISSQDLYLRGFLIYLAGMSGIYLCLSLAGPAMVMPILGAFSNPNGTTAPFARLAAPDSSPTAPRSTGREAASGPACPKQSGTEEQPVPVQWPFALALAMVGLAPNISGLRKPEILLRRFSHSIALIPAYAKYIAFQMQLSPFDFSQYVDFAYVGVGYQPTASSTDALDKNWRKICTIFAHVKRYSAGVDVPRSGHALDDGSRTPLAKEVLVFSSLLRELDLKLQNNELPAEQRTVLVDDAQKLLLRAYLLASCTLIAFGVRDWDAEVKFIGFTQMGATPSTIGPVLMIFTLLFGVLLVINQTLSAIFGHSQDSVWPTNFSFNCISTAYFVATYVVAVAVAVKQRDRLEARGRKLDHGGWASRFVPFFLIAASGYFATWLLLAVLLFPALGLAALDSLIEFATLRSLAPGMGGVLVALWLGRQGPPSLSMFVREYATAILGLAAFATFSSFLLVNEGPVPHPIAQLAFDAMQGMFGGLAISCLTEVLRTSRADLRPALAQPQTVVANAPLLAD